MTPCLKERKHDVRCGEVKLEIIELHLLEELRRKTTYLKEATAITQSMVD